MVCNSIAPHSPFPTFLASGVLAEDSKSPGDLNSLCQMERSISWTYVGQMK